MNKRIFLALYFLIIIIGLSLLMRTTQATTVTLTIKVLDKESNKPIIGAHVLVIRSLKDFKYREFKLTDENGLATFTLPKMGQYLIEVSAPEYVNKIVEIDINKDEYFISISIYKPETLARSQIDESDEFSGIRIVALSILLFLLGITFYQMKEKKILKRL